MSAYWEQFDIAELDAMQNEYEQNQDDPSFCDYDTSLCQEKDDTNTCQEPSLYLYGLSWGDFI